MTRTGILDAAWAIRRIPFGTAELDVAALQLTDGCSRRPLLLLAADIIWFPDGMAGRLRAAIARAGGIDEAAVILAASHTHGSPQPEPRFPFGRQDPAWAADFERAALATAEQALAAAPVPVTLHFGRAAIDPPVAVNRRRAAFYREGARIGRRVQSLPNDAAAVDSRVSVLIARDAGNGAVRAIVVHAVCHPVTLPRDATGPDFPGVVRERLAARYGADLPVLFLQGHCGDVRPRLVHAPSGLKDRTIELLIGPRFRPSRDGDAERVGGGIAAAAEKAIETARPIEPDFAAVRGRLPLHDETGAAVGRDLDITAWRMSPDLSIVAASGEMLSGLASPDPRVLSVGYANGMVGYVAPGSEYAGGGYEVDGFLQPFGLTRRFSPETGKRFDAERGRLLASQAATLSARPRGAEATARGREAGAVPRAAS